MGPNDSICRSATVEMIHGRSKNPRFSGSSAMPENERLLCEKEKESAASAALTDNWGSAPVAVRRRRRREKEEKRSGSKKKKF
jgi:hypothetical protein